MKKHRPQGTGSWEASPRFLPSPASSPAADDAGRVLSPLRRRSVSDAPRKLRPSAPALWPSSRKPGTLADHLGNDRLIDLVERKAGDRPASATPAASPQSIIRQRSCSEFGRFDDKEEKEKGRRFSRLDDRDEKEKGRRLGRLDDKEEKEKGRRFGRLDDKEGKEKGRRFSRLDDRGEKEKGRRFGRLDDKEEKEKGRGSKENRPIGGSMRYIGKIGFPRSPKPGSPPSPSSGATLTLTPGRISVDENALFLRRKSDFGLDYASSESDRSDTKIPTPRVPKSEAAKTIGRARSMSAYGSASTQWALSPGRRSESPPTAAAAEGRAAGMGRSFSNLRPPSPGKGKKVGNFISMGLDLFHFRRRSFSGSTAGGGGCSSPTLSSSSHSSLVVGSPSAGGAGAMGEAGHQFRVMHNRLIQWRYVNARSDVVNGIRMATSESRLVMVSAEVTRLQSRVVQKRLQLERERMALKLNTLLSSQMKALESWGDMERQHSSALSTTKDCLQATVCRVPVIDGAEVEPQHLSAALRQAKDVIPAITATINVLIPTAQNTVPLLSELAHVITRERTLLEECSELLDLVATLRQIQEQSLKCHLIQLNSLQQQQRLKENIDMMTN